MNEINYRIWNGTAFVYSSIKRYAYEVSTPYFDGVIQMNTGLKDRSSREIYDGDIVVIEHPAWSERCITEFRHGSFIFRALTGPSENVVVPGWTFMRETGQVQVIGNIYENPKLLPS